MTLLRTTVSVSLCQTGRDLRERLTSRRVNLSPHNKSLVSHVDLVDLPNTFVFHGPGPGVKDYILETDRESKTKISQGSVESTVRRSLG